MTGNVGRKLLQNYARLAQIIFPKLRQETGQALIQALGNFWIGLVCGWVVDPDKFGDYCNHVDNMFRTHVEWHPGVPGGYNSMNKWTLNLYVSLKIFSIF